MADIATRQAYGAALAKLGEYMDIVVLDADLSKSTMTNTFKQVFPERFINCGIAESNMMSVAAGIAATGKTVFASTFAMFAAGRAYEQVRNSIGYAGLNVKIGATHAGLSVGEDGATHQCNEDIALMRTIPGMTVIVPSDAEQTMQAIRIGAEIAGPVYFRLGRLAVPAIYDEGYSFEIGKGYTLRDGADMTLIACGLMTHEALGAADILAASGIEVRVIDMPTIKPIDKDLIIKAASETGLIVTCEEHSVIGGLGSAVADVTGEYCPVPVKKIGVQDQFGKSGDAKTVLKLFGLTREAIAQAALDAMNLKK